MLSTYEKSRMEVIKYSIKVTTQLDVKWRLEDELKELEEKQSIQL
jgi:hypothetical protein